MPFVEQRLVVEEVHLGGTPAHEKIDDALDLGVLMGRTEDALIGKRGVAVAEHEVGQCETAQAHAELIEESSTREAGGVGEAGAELGVHGVRVGERGKRFRELSEWGRDDLSQCQ